MTDKKQITSYLLVCTHNQEPLDGDANITSVAVRYTAVTRGAVTLRGEESQIPSGGLCIN